MNKLHFSWIYILVPFLILVLPILVRAQEMPPRPVSASIIRDLRYGAFSQGPIGGTVTVYASGSRNSTGDIVLLTMGFLYYPALFELSGNPGTVLHFLAGPATTLTGTNGGALTMVLGQTDPSTPFILPWAGGGTLEVSVGGTLTIGSPIANPAGDYTGTFMVMFIQE